jgi:hypothetical protein
MSGPATDAPTALEESRRAAGAPGFDGAKDEAVAAFVRRHRQLEPLLRALRRDVDAHFDPQTPILLELATDPEEGDATLFARIGTTLSTSDAMQRLDTLVDAWWLENMPRAGGLLHLDVRQI